MLTTLFVWQTHYLFRTLSNEALYFEKIQTKKSGEKIDSYWIILKVFDYI